MELIEEKLPLRRLTQAYKTTLEAGFMALPAAAVIYLFVFQRPALAYENQLFHVVAISVSILLSFFAAWVALRCYLDGGDPSLRWVTLAFAGFGIVYLPHGLLTHTAHDNIWLFLLFGPASRVVMGAFLLAALLHYRDAPDPPAERRRLSRWLPWLALCLVVVALVPVLAHSPLASSWWVRLVQEGVAIGLNVAGVVVIIRQGRSGGLMWLYQVALLSFAQSSVAFLLTTAWTHLWWLAHLVFAAGFFLLSYGLVRAFHTTRSFAKVYSEDEMVALLAAREAEAKAFREGEERLRGLFDASPVGIAVSDVQGRVLYCNQNYARSLGLTQGEVLSRPIQDGFADPTARDRLAAQALAEGQPVQAELEVRHADGLPRWQVVTWLPTVYAGRRSVVAWTLDVTERRQATEMLRRAKEAAELANRAKTEFLANMSHELRTPLNAINGFAETMRAQIFGPLGSERYVQYAGHILDSGRHLADLINDVLDVSRIESGAMTLSEESFRIQRVIEAALLMIGDRARQAGVTVTTEMDSALPVLWADSRRVKQVLINLLSNAVKFTPAGGRIRIIARPDDQGAVRISVSDSGIGMDADMHERALTPFTQLDGGDTRHFEGLGLGLPLCRNLMRLHGGSLSIDSAIGQGTTVTVAFPPERSLACAEPRSA